MRDVNCNKQDRWINKHVSQKERGKGAYDT